MMSSQVNRHPVRVKVRIGIWFGYLVMLVLQLGSRTVCAQSPVWQEAVAATQVGPADCLVRTTVVVNSGDVIIAGNFSGTVSFGTTTLTSTGLEDIFIAKWNSSTNSFTWAQSVGGSGMDNVTSVAVSGISIYLTGSFDSQVIGLGTIGLTNIGAGFGTSTDLFVAKLEDAGNASNFIWAKRIGGLGDEFAGSVAVNGPNVYVTGAFTGFSDFDGTLLTAAGNYDVFVTKLTDAGSSVNVNWALQAGGLGNDYASAIAVNGPNIYVAGSFANVGNFGATMLNSAGSQDVFVAKLIDLGTAAAFTWAQRAGGSLVDEATSLAVSGPNIYVGGHFDAAADFGTTSLNNEGLADIFVAKLTDAGSTGSFTWAQQAGSTGDDVATALAVSGTGVYATGYFSRTLHLGSLSLTSTGNNDVFVTKFIDMGQSSAVSWAVQAGGTDNDQAFALSLTNSNVSVAGWFAGSAAFGTHNISSFLNSQAGFLATLINITGLGVTTPELWAKVDLAPNPAHNYVTLQFPAKTGNKHVTYTLMDISGRVVSTHSTHLPAIGLKTDLSLADLPAGIYLLQVVMDGVFSTQRLMVE